MRIAAALLALCAACSLLFKSEPRSPRYFSPESATAAAEPTSERTTPARARVRLGRITPSAHLRYRIVHRESAVELDPYESLRWTEVPDAYVHRALVRALFDGPALEQALRGPVATLDVDVVAFEEIRRGAGRAGRVQLRYLLHDERAVLARGVVTIERDAGGVQIDRVVAAIGAALDAATREVADRVITRLCGDDGSAPP